MAFQFPQLIRPRKESKARQRRHLSMKEGSLSVLFVCTNKIHRTGRLQITFLVSLESSQGRIGLVSWCLDLRCKSS